MEASAGTGKTTSLVSRIVNLVATGRATLDRIAAITFTEAAAAELRDRIRQDLEKAAEDAARSDEEREHCRRGVADLDQAAIRTLHAFAASLLHERPLEAGLPPGFETSDDIAAGIRFNEAWSEWLDHALETGSPLAYPMSVAITLGMRLDQLKDVAKEFHENYADLISAGFGGAEPLPSSAGETLSAAWHEIERLCQYSKNGDEDPLYNHARSKSPALRRLAAAEPGSPGYYRLLRRVLPFSFRLGRQTDWNVDPVSGDNACTALKNRLKELHDAVAGEIEETRNAALLPILEELRLFVLGYARRRRAEGRAEFHDLLVWARELLRDNLEVRDHFRRRFSHLLIDEAQDTDPIQTEIAMFLAESAPEGTPDDARPMSWERIAPEKGKLFVVGDPKQSIYRFRRADVAQMWELQQRMKSGGREHREPGAELSLPGGHHSLGQPVVRGVDERQPQREPRRRATYRPITRDMVADGNHTSGQTQTQVWALANQLSDGGMDEVRRQEAEDIATLLRQMKAQQWQMLDKGASEAAGKEVFRAVGYSDVCILMPTRTGIRALERGLEGGNIPYRLESASLIFETQEIRDLMNCLKATDDPSNQVAIVAALRSPAFGCSDVDLLRHYEQGGRFNYLARQEEPHEGPVAEALAALKDFHEQRGWSSAGALIDRIIRERGLMQSAIGHPRMREQWRRYRFLVERARQFEAAGGGSLRAFVEWTEEQISERARVTEVPVPESDEDSVRVMTIHAAKGLEFPVVILTGINSVPPNRPAHVVFDRQDGSDGSAEVGFGARNNRISTGGYEELLTRENVMSEAERVRLMYVATTRARDHLVLSLRRTAKDGEKSAAGIIADYLPEYGEFWQEGGVDQLARSP